MSTTKRRRKIKVNSDLVTLPELAKHYSVSERTIYRWIEQEIIPSGRRITPRCTRYSLKETADALKENTI